MHTSAMILKGTCGVLFSAWVVCADSGVWNVQSGGAWSDPANWLDGGVACGSKATAYFTNAPGSSVTRPVVMVDTNLLLNGLSNWMGDGSAFTFAPVQMPGGSSFYTVGIGTNDFAVYSGRPVVWKTTLEGSGAVKLSGVGLFAFSKNQTFTGPLYLVNRSAYKGISYQSFAESTNQVTGDLLASQEINIDYSTLKVSGRYPRAASTGKIWELRAGSSQVTLLEAGTNTETFLSPGQAVTGEHIQEGTCVAFFQTDSTVFLSQPVMDNFTGSVTQTLSFAAAPRWETVQQVDKLVSQSSEASAVSGVQMQPLIASGYGSNTVTLHAGELSGTRPVLVSVDSGNGGWDGRLRVDRAEAFQQTVSLKNTAALVLGDQRPVPGEPSPAAAFWVDASDEASLTKDSAGNITRWDDTRGSGYPYAAAWLAAPVYMTNALNGLPAVDFGAQGSTRCLQWSAEIAGVQTVFWVVGSQAGGGNLLGRGPAGTAGSFIRGFDALRGGTAYVGRENGLIGINEATGENLWVNGQLVTMSGAGFSGDYDMVAATIGGVRDFKASAFGRVDGQADRYQGGQRLCEVLVYTNALTTQQIADTQAYLYKKWFNRDTFGYGAGKIDFLVTASGANARIGQAGTQPVEARYVTHGGNLAVMAGSTVTLKADAALPKLTLENGAKVILKARKIPSAPAMNGNILWLDAAREEDFTFGGGAAVNAWRNRGGGSVQAVTPGAVKPARVQDVQGRWVVDLGARDAGCCLMTLTNLMARSAFAVWLCKTNGAMPLGSLKQGYAGHTEFCPSDFQRNGGAAMLSGAVRTSTYGAWYLDGLPIQATATPIPTNRLILTSAVMQGWGGRVSAVGGNGFDNTSATYLYSGGMQLAEVLLYDITLTEDARRDVEAYLTWKWFGRRLAGYADVAGSCDLPEVAVSGAAEVEAQGNAVVRIAKATGAGMLTVGGAMPVIVTEVVNPNTLAVTLPAVTAGVKVSRESGGGAPAVPAPGAAMRFDASVASSITLYSGTYAQYWADQIGGVKAESAAGVTSWIPIYKTNAANGLPVIDFEWRGRQRAFKWSPRLTNIRTAFWMFKDKGAAQGGGWLLGDTTKVSDFIRGSWGTLYGNSSLFDTTLASTAVRNGTVFIDGERCNAATVPKWNYQVVSLVAAGDVAADMIAGDCATIANWSGLEVGEVILYTNALSDAECEATEDYLMNKWLGRRSPRVACADTQMVVTAWGSVPLTVTAINGDDNRIAALRGDGDVVIDGSDVTVLSDAETFSGRVVLKNNSTATLAAESFAAAEWIVEAGSVLDLGGQTVTVAGIGGDGCVSNGTLIVTHVTPGASGEPGTLTVKGDLILADGATITAHYRVPQGGKIAVEGELTVEGAGTVDLESPVGLNAGCVFPLITYGTCSGIDLLQSDWTLTGDYAQAAYTCRLEHKADEHMVRYRAFTQGTLVTFR